MIALTLENLAACTGARIDRAQRFLAELAFAMEAYAIDTPQRAAPFLAEIGHESGGLRYTAELWGPTPQQARYERDFSEPWPESADDANSPDFHRNALAFRLGNSEEGDGARFKGHGLLQTTGRFNHARVRDRLREKFPDLAVPDFEEDPDALGEAKWAALSAADFWDEHGINQYADAGDFDGCSDVINRGHKTRAYGDAIGFPDRLARYKAAVQALA